MTTVTQTKTLALIAFAEECGWTVKSFESGRPTLSGRPRFILILVREEAKPFTTLYSLQIFIGSGRVSGAGMVLGFGTDYESKIGDWNSARRFLGDFPTKV